MSFSLKAGDSKNLWLGRFDIFPEDLFVHGISTRHGGVSTGAYASLNLGLHVSDEQAAVVENRRIFCKGLQVEPERTVTCQQVHGSNIVRVSKAEAGAGFADYETAIADTDALITNEVGLPLMLFFADCTPILLADPVHKAVGLAHGGWKGTVAAIAAQTVAMMRQEFGSRPEDLLAAIGPAIGPCCYAVGTEVAQQFRQAFPDFQAQILREEDGEIKLDLWQANALQLQAAGLKPEHIEVAGVCTACHNKQFFSYRADKGKTGRIAALICIR